MAMDTSLLGILSVVILGWIRELRERLAEALRERNSARLERDHWFAEWSFMRRGYDALASMYLTVTRRMPDAEPLPFDPDALRSSASPPRDEEGA
jgi:hypothetical protein